MIRGIGISNYYEIVHGNTDLKHFIVKMKSTQLNDLVIYLVKFFFLLGGTIFLTINYLN